MDRRVLTPRFVAILMLPIVLTGCVTGQRGRLMTELSATGNEAIDAVLSQLEAVSGAVFTADYDVLTVYPGTDTAVTIAQSAPARRITIVGDVAFIVDGGPSETCTVSTDECQDGIDAARTSDVQLTPDFWGTSATARLRAEAGVATGPPVPSSEIIAGQNAICVAIPVPDDTVTTCVLDDGVLARLDGSDIELTMTSYSPDADETLWP